MGFALEGATCPWPGQVAPRLVAQRALEAIAAADYEARDQVLERVLDCYPGCAADMVRSHVATALLAGDAEHRERRVKSAARMHIHQARELALRGRG